MDTILEQLIVDFHDKKLPTLTRRHAKLNFPAWLWAMSRQNSVI